MTTRLIAVVGPSGVGKDSVMQALADTHGLPLVRRVITRPTAAGGEDFTGVTDADFARLKATGSFVLDWRAHGLRYGIPRAQVQGDGDRLVNLSRAVLGIAQNRLPALEVILLTAPREVLRERLTARGRESAGDIEARLDRAALALPDGIRHHVIDNARPLDQTVAAITARLYPSSGAV